jgi:hypothetical protein
MKIDTKSNWQSIWLKKGNSIPDETELTLMDLIRADGFNSGAGDYNLESWKSLTDYVIRKLGINQQNQILEVGCGGQC